MIKSSSKVAIVGPSGVGKSTSVLLLLKLIETNEGCITINGININDITKNSLYKNISSMCQQSVLYNRSILDNIRYGNNASLSEIRKIMKELKLDDKISKLQYNYNTIANKETLSGGEVQRILIARAIASNPKILMFDEATSALDNVTQKKVADSLEGLDCTRKIKM